jgi:hypothetical protein
MRAPVPTTLPHGAKLAIGIVGLAAATGVAFAAWANSGAGIFLALVESGLAWCM